MSDATISLSILVVVVLLVWNRFPVELVAVGAALALFFSGVLTLDESLAGFGDPAVILIAALFVVSEGLDATGVTTWLGRTLVEKAGGSSRRLLVFTMLLSAGLTALIGLNRTVATPANMMVMGPGGYRFDDYWRLGLVLVMLFFAVSVGLVPLVWRF
ncbi:MAG TPA: SLC13 family permease [Candidatus Binatia bacterium]|nr:SLC13 family permease [Candidatus Binatia bacterium]